MNRALPLAVAALLSAGCIPDTKSIDPYRSAAAVCPVLFDVVTSRLSECSGFSPYLASAYYAGTVQSCGMIGAAEAAGRIGYDRAKAEACISAFSAPGCGSLNNACSDLPFVPRVVPGGACVNDLECTAASAGCFSPTLTCPGHCLLPGSTAGTSRCISGVDPPCAPSLYCDATGATPTCRARTADGAACSAAPCATASYCDTSTAPSTCRPQVAAGGTCTGYGQCSDAQSLYCNIPNGASSGTCAAPSLASLVNGRCDWPNQCAASLWCDYTTTPIATCKAKVADNATCTSGNGCSAAGSTCVIPSGSSSGTCQPLKTEGATCTQGQGECQRGLSCLQLTAGATPRCARWPGPGGACGTLSGEYVSCAIGSYCSIPSGASAGTCLATVAAGQACPTYNECGNDGLGFTRTQCLRSPTTGTLVCVAPCSLP